MLTSKLNALLKDLDSRIASTMNNTEISSSTRENAARNL